MIVEYKLGKSPEMTFEVNRDGQETRVQIDPRLSILQIKASALEVMSHREMIEFHKLTSPHPRFIFGD